MKTPSTFVLPENTAPWMLPSSLEEIPRLQRVFSGCRDSKSKAADVMPSGEKTLENQNDFDSPHSAQEQDLLNLELSFSNLITQGQRWNDQNIPPGMVFPKQAFRCGPRRYEIREEEDTALDEMKIWKRAEKRVTQEEDSSLMAEMKIWEPYLEMAEMKMWKGRSEFGQTVLRYSRNHCSED